MYLTVRVKLIVLSNKAKNYVSLSNFDNTDMFSHSFSFTKDIRFNLYLIQTNIWFITKIVFKRRNCFILWRINCMGPTKLQEIWYVCISDFIKFPLFLRNFYHWQNIHVWNIHIFLLSNIEFNSMTRKKVVLVINRWLAWWIWL